MELFFDARFIRVGQHDGISRFSVGLFEALSENNELIAIICDLRQLDKLPKGTNYLKVNDPTSLSELWVARKLNRAGAKYVFSTMQTMGSWGRKYKLVLTLHDLIYYRHPAPPPSLSFPIRVLWRLYHLSFWPQRLLLNRADAIATVSETTKRLVLENKLCAKPISVVYNAANPIIGESAGFRTERPNRPLKLVYMGSFMAYKNVEVLIRGMQFLPEHELHLLSRISESRKASLERLVPNSAQVVFHNGISEGEYAKLLGEALALVTASLDEGFGIPLIEAMSLGTPAVVSDIAIFREIGGEAAIYFDPLSPMDFANAVKKLDSNREWLSHSKLSMENAKRFDWKKSAKALEKVFRNLGA